MNKRGLLFLILLIIISCKNDDAGIDTLDQNKVLLLKFDFESYVFEEVKELIFETDMTFDISAEYLEAGDFGGITLLYKDTEEKIFSGTIIWNGKGEINFPENFTKASDLQKITTPVEMPDVSKFQKVLYSESAYYPNTIDYQKIWDQINTLALLKEYRLSNPSAKIDVLLYTPTVGVLDPSVADWIMIVKN